MWTPGKTDRQTDRQTVRQYRLINIHGNTRTLTGRNKRADWSAAGISSILDHMISKMLQRDKQVDVNSYYKNGKH